MEFSWKSVALSGLQAPLGGQSGQGRCEYKVLFICITETTKSRERNLSFLNVVSILLKRDYFVTILTVFGAGWAVMTVVCC